ncbi:MAG: FecR domain-containing protein [Treponema sp.]|nr:FecR domain-containing protein [Treponema sp.]
MKKILIAVLLIVLVTTFVFSQNGTIRELTGDVELKHAGSSAFVTASAGDVITPNTIVSTGFRSTTVIAVGNSLITVRPLTRLSFAEIQTAQADENVNVNLQAGRVRVEVTPPAGTRTNLTVQSPSATASVRGTIFEMDMENMSTVEGKVILTGTSGLGVIVTEGNSSSTKVDGTIADPAEIAALSTQPQSPVGTPPPSLITTTTETSTGNMDFSFTYH